ncbi:hypothetical protein [Spiroplasma turonicum]|uniref:Transmembrane protein n=1 Tax=Spiroplasma turonicum TaxID=216946 RepID=A0A0K1P639_9MOLU|nr:hypothetical protein [Spiroplasma turonicum]AKU79766.1 hypothetical protein STURON_00520 [Spiroplasma turonicum]ALX70784.1 hypothetical protein STURO_v1c05180 [Spiroplasma turonicum]
MKKIIYEIVFITIMAFLYYLYSSWVDKFDTNELIYKIFSPFKLLILASIFSIFYGAIKTILFYNIKNLKDYKKNLRNNILFEFEITIKYLKDLKNSLDLGDTNKIKLNIKEYNSIKYKPIYLNLLIDEVTTRILSDHDYSDLIQSCNLVIRNIENTFEKEKSRMSHKKSESFFILKRVNEYYNINSWFVISFFLSIHNKDVHSHEYEVNKWKITSLYVSRFSYFLYPAFIFSLILYLSISIVFNVTEIPLNRFFYGTFPISVFLISTILFIINLILNKKKYNIKIFWLHLSIYLIFIFFIFIDMFLNVILSPIMKSSDDWYESDLITFLCYLVYIVLSTMLLSYIFTSILELIEYKKINWINLIFNIFLPLTIFINSTILNYLSVNDTNSNKLYLINFLIIFIYWLFSLITSKYIFKE